MKGTELKLGGKKYTPRAFSLNMMVRLKKEWECKTDRDFHTLLGEKLEVGGMETMNFLLWYLLRDDYPDLTEEALGEMITAKNLPMVSEVMTELMGTGD